MKPSYRWILATMVVVLLLAAATLSAASWTRSVVSTAKAGKARAEAGVRSLAAMDATAAVSEFGDANRDFSSVTQALGARWLSGASGSIPWVARQYSAVRTLARVGQEGSLAGLEMAKAVQTAPAGTAAVDSTAATLSSRLVHVDAALAAMSSAAQSARSLSPDGLVGPLAQEVLSLQAAVRKSGFSGDRPVALAQLGSYLLSGEHRIIVVSQDGAELRPTGGWAGSFGILDVGASGVRLESYQDVFTLPSPPNRPKPPPGAVQTSGFNFRNANWWLDFPTSAQAMLGFWKDYGQKPVDGIVVIDTVVMADLLGVVGPITVPAFNQTFTPANLLDRLLYLTQVERGGQLSRKDVLVDLAEELEKRLLALGPRDLAKAAAVVGKAADAKHVQMYFTDPKAQAAADALKWSGRVAPPAGTTDVVAISNAMNKPGKVNIAMKKTIAYDVALQPDRSAETTLVLGFANTGPYPYPYLPPDFRDWLRVYRLPGTVFPATTPDGSATTTMTDFGFPAEVRTFMLARGQSQTEVLTAKVPGALRAEAANPAAGMRYRLYMVRQADLEDIPTTVTVTAPPGWRLTGAAAVLVASGAMLPVTVETQRARMAVPLSGDLTLDVRVASP